MAVAEARTIKSAAEASKRLRRLKARFTAAMDDFTIREAKELLTVIKDEWVPVDQGDLRDSGRVERVKVNQHTRKTIVSFNTPYAWEQHENLDYRHSVGTAKYVERPLLQAMNGMSTRLADDVKARVR